MSTSNRFREFLSSSFLHLLLCLFSLLMGKTALWSQRADNDVWYSFTDESEELIGYQNEQGEIKIPAMFPSFAVNAKKFENIIGLIDASNDQSYHTYYLLKDGRRIAKDSVYFSDNIQDCESEKTIRFQDPKSKKIGFLDGNGNILIDAEYNWASKFQNGLSFVIKNAKKECLDNDHTDGENCEHWWWKGGDSLFINMENEILIRHVHSLRYLDVYRYQEISKLGSDSTLIYLKSEGNSYYAFENIQLQFQQWVNNISPKKNAADFYTDELTYWDINSEQWMTVSTDKLPSDMMEKIEELLGQVQRDDSSFFISREALNPFIFSDNKYQNYFDNCGSPLENQFPVMSIIINHVDSKGESYQDHLDFLRTPKGYRLISISIRY